jgi:hypothetical protein
LCGIKRNGTLQGIDNGLSCHLDHDDGVLKGEAIRNVLDPDGTRRVDLVAANRAGRHHGTIRIVVKPHDVADQISDIALPHPDRGEAGI